MLQDHAGSFLNIKARQAERELSLAAVNNLMSEYLKGIPRDQWDISITNRLYQEARARALYGL